MKYEAYAELPAEKVLAACQRFNEYRRQDIARRREQLVNQMMARRWFRPSTREDAHRLLREGHEFSEYHLIELRGGLETSIVQEVAALASASKTTVLLSSRAAHILGDLYA